MKYPALVPYELCKTEVNVTLYTEDINEDGAPESIDLGALKCNYQDTGAISFKDRNREVKVTGTAYFPGDIAESITNITAGKVIINGKERSILQGVKARNPDGTVNYTLLNLE